MEQIKPVRDVEKYKEYKTITKDKKATTKEFKKESNEYVKNTDKITDLSFLDKL